MGGNRPKKYNYINTKGQKLLKENYYFAEDFNDGLAKVGNEQEEGSYWKTKLGYIDTEGDEIIPLRYNELSNFSDGLATAKIGKGFGYINKKGEMQITFQDKFTGNDFNNGLALASEPHNEYYIDKNGNIKIKLIDNPDYYNDYSDFSEGLASIRKNQKIGFINTKGIFVIAPNFEGVSKFNNGYALVLKQENKKENSLKIGFIDKSGKEITFIKYDNIIQEFLSDNVRHNDNNFRFEESCNLSNEINVYNLMKINYEFFKNDIERMELFGQQYYIDKNGFEYFQK